MTDYSIPAANATPELDLSAFNDVANAVVQALNTVGTKIEQAQVTGMSAGPPRTCTLNVNGVSVSGVRILDNVDPVINAGVWYADMGSGRWLVIGNNSSSGVRPQYVLNAGDTMTGALNGTSASFTGTVTAATGFSGPGGSLTALNATQLTTGTVPSARISGAYTNITGLGTIGGTLTAGAFSGDGSSITQLNATNLSTGTVASARISGSYTGITAVGTLSSLTVSGLVSTGSGSSNGIDLGNSGGWYTQDTTWVRTKNNKSVWCGSGWLGTDGGLTVGWNGATSGSFSIYSSGSLFTLGQLRAGRNGGSSGSGASSSNYYDATIYADPADSYGASTASIAFHPGGVAPQLRVGYNNDTIYVQNSAGTDTTSVLSGQLTDTSSRRYKQEITSWPPASMSAAAPSALTIVSQLRATTYTFKTDLTQTVAGRRLEALRRLNEYNRKKDRPAYTLRQHDCAIDGCDGTPDDPCARVIRSRTQRLGLIAEEAVEVLPELVDINDKKEPDGIRYSGVATLAIAAIQELIVRVEALEQDNKALRDRLTAAGIA